MTQKNKEAEKYEGFEQGPIRPPSEANSLLIRVTRNCPWNRCTFCPVYKSKRRKFSLRPVEHVKKDIDTIHKYVDALRKAATESGSVNRETVLQISENVDPGENVAFQAALHWFAGGLRSVFIQDANSLIIKPADLVDILEHLKNRFPWVERITSYARSHTVARISDDNLEKIRKAGLNRIHIGLESGSDNVLKKVRKGVSKETQVTAGQKVVKAKMELSEYVMPGLGGRELSREHALETADALNRINPDFIRLRTLALPNRTELYREYEQGRFEKLTEVETVREILWFIESLEGITSYIKSDHVLNLFQDLEGRLPEDKPRMIQILQSFLDLPPEEQCVYLAGRRMGIFSGLGDMDSPARRKKAESLCREMEITPDNVETMVYEMMKRFV